MSSPANFGWQGAVPLGGGVVVGICLDTFLQGLQLVLTPILYVAIIHINCIILIHYYSYRVTRLGYLLQQLGPIQDRTFSYYKKNILYLLFLGSFFTYIVYSLPLSPSTMIGYRYKQETLGCPDMSRGY